MDLTFLGATRTVTGSCHLLRFNDKQVLLDCGLFQGGRELEEMNYMGFHFAPKDIDYVLLSHAHIDHAGLLPRLYKLGFNGKIICTHATKELCKIMLPDSGYLQEEAARQLAKRLTVQGKTPRPPLYTQEDAILCMKAFRSVDYDKHIDLEKDLTVRFRDAGHILGSSFIEIWAKEGKDEVQILFSGDLGQTDQPIIRDPTIPSDSSPDYLLIESTYGNKLHESYGDREQQLVDAVKGVQRSGGKLVIPAFAVGRTQNLLYYLNKALNEGHIDKIKVYVDSPLAIDALSIYASHPECFDQETLDSMKDDPLPLDFPGLTMSKSVDESKAINEDMDPAIIIAASGMCEGGRIRHHLKHNIWRREATILFVSFQAEGTLGRQIMDGNKEVRIFGEEYHVAAKVMQITGFSAHADKDGLIRWASKLKGKPSQTFVVHGEMDNSEPLARALGQKLRHNVMIPRMGDRVQLRPRKR